MCANKIAPKTPNESRKIRKPLMEKKRRARINDCLEELKKLLIHNKRECVPEVRPSKLEKADILEQTVIFMKKLVNDPVMGYNQGFIDSEERTKSKIAAYENLSNNEKQRLFSFLFNENRINAFTYEKCFLNHQNSKENVWRPW